MRRFNLLREPWIAVVSIETGRQEDVSILDLFHNAGRYRALAGDMETQDFAVLRMLLAIVHTVFSRFDAEGEPYSYISLNEKMRQTEPVAEDDIEEYAEDSEDTWNNLWIKGCFPEILFQYLETWEDRFYLFDDKYPFYQCTKEEMDARLPVGKKASPIAGKNFNRTISESGNKTALFSPESGRRKGCMTEAELARWLIMLQCYIGLSDKTALFKNEGQPSKGWLFDIGGIYLKGNTVYETLMMNYIPVHSRSQYQGVPQSPCWEHESGFVLDRLINVQGIGNIAELYTNWSRAVYIDPDTRMNSPLTIGIAKLPAIQHTDQFLEPMTVWRRNLSGDMKNHHTPRKHLPEQAMWQSFGLIAMDDSLDEDRRKPEIMRQYDRIKKRVGIRSITLQAVSMKDDGNATSWVPTDEITDALSMNDFIISDNTQSGWVVRINEKVDETKKIVEYVYASFLKTIVEIRGMDPKKEGATFVEEEKREMYQYIDGPFQSWLENLKPDDSIEERLLEWNRERNRLIDERAQNILELAGERDFRGIVENDRTINIFTAYHQLRERMKRYS